MGENSSKENKILSKNNFTNWIIGGIIALIVGKIMEPLFSYLFLSFLKIGGSFLTYIANSTYREISNGSSEQSASFALYLIYLCIFCYLGHMLGESINSYQSLKIAPKKHNKISIPKDENILLSELNTLKKQSKRLRISYIFIIIVIILFMTALILFYGRSSFIRNKSMILTNNIEIVSPYISDIEYKQLKSKFHSIETQSDYEALMERLKSIAEEYSLKLK